MATLHLFRGYPGSGKSTAAAQMFPGIVKFENDQFLMRDGKYCWSKESVQDAIKWCFSSVENALKNSFDVVVANTFTKRRFITAYEKLVPNTKNRKPVIDSLTRIASDYRLVRPVRTKALELLRANSGAGSSKNSK
jgi:predicted kinase